MRRSAWCDYCANSAQSGAVGDKHTITINVAGEEITHIQTILPHREKSARRDVDKVIQSSVKNHNDHKRSVYGEILKHNCCFHAMFCIKTKKVTCTFGPMSESEIHWISKNRLYSMHRSALDIWLWRSRADSRDFDEFHLFLFVQESLIGERKLWLRHYIFFTVVDEFCQLPIGIDELNLSTMRCLPICCWFHFEYSTSDSLFAFVKLFDWIFPLFFLSKFSCLGAVSSDTVLPS